MSTDSINDGKYIDLFLTLDNSNNLQIVRDFYTYEVIPYTDIDFISGNYLKIHLAADDVTDFSTFNYVFSSVNEDNLETKSFTKVVKDYSSNMYDSFYEATSTTFHTLPSMEVTLTIYKYISDISGTKTQTGVSNSITLFLKTGTILNNTFNMNEATETSFNELINDIYSRTRNGRLVSDLKVANATDFNSPITAGSVYGLYVKYTGTEGYIKIGDVSPSLIDLGLIKERNASSGGGGKVGVDAKLYSNNTGFAGGFQSKARGGGSIGNKAVAYYGVAGGENATNINATDGIVIGRNACLKRLPEDSYKDGEKKFDSGSVVIGTKAATLEDNSTYKNNVVIGNNANITSSTRSIAIGGNNYDASNGKNFYDDSTKGSTISFSALTRVNYSSDATALGSQAFITRGNYGIAIGNRAIITGVGISDKFEKGYNCRNSIVIGTQSLCRSSASIALGYKAQAGTSATKGVIYGNYEEDNSDYDNKKDKAFGYVAAIAIGHNAKARRNSTISIGKNSGAYQYGCIAIGKNATAGKDQIKGNTNAELAKGTTQAIAIGVEANALSTGAVQIGKGTNSEKNTFKYQEVTIVKDGYVQNNLENGQTGILPFKNGGTGAKSRTQARRNLGIYTGEKEFTISTDGKDLHPNGGLGVVMKVEFNTKFSGIPKVVASLGFDGGTEDDKNPIYHHLLITDVKEDHFIVKYNYTGTVLVKKNDASKLIDLKPKVNFVLIYI